MNASLNAIDDTSLRNVFINTSIAKAAASRLVDIHNDNLRTGTNKGFLIMGPSGVGKSVLVKKYVNSVNTERAIEKERLPILYLDMPSAPTKKNLGAALLKALDDPYANMNSESAEAKFSRVVKLLDSLSVELVILDEAQHLVDYKRGDAYEAGDWIKSLINNSKVSVVLVGMTRLEGLKRVNAQFRRRFSASYTLMRFRPGGEFWPEFAGVIKAMQKVMVVDSVSLVTDEMINRFYFASFGLLDYLVKILERAVCLVRIGRFDGVNLAVLDMAFKDEVWQLAPGNRSPFNKEFDFRPLVGPDEPYEKIE
ncbi:TniB family NTP-binding protein [Pseudomonas gingeri]|uniref:TniB family NTP-binding protein n=1 Tax=Pseudomonas gingeri TaxID=117681 RepID=UPI0015A4C9EC|nr:TniB family NTP-binding protein [Pseudomonas gingeri]NWD69170.1 TniB family NTP-binding protein [Pseudomonas gingeri]